MSSPTLSCIRREATFLVLSRDFSIIISSEDGEEDVQLVLILEGGAWLSLLLLSEDVASVLLAFSSDDSIFISSEDGEEDVQLVLLIDGGAMKLLLLSELRWLLLRGSQHILLGFTLSVVVDCAKVAAEVFVDCLLLLIVELVG